MLFLPVLQMARIWVPPHIDDIPMKSSKIKCVYEFDNEDDIVNKIDDLKRARHHLTNEIEKLERLKNVIQAHEKR